jgi:hypothetical protein
VVDEVNTGWKVAVLGCDLGLNRRQCRFKLGKTHFVLFQGNLYFSTQVGVTGRVETVKVEGVVT